MIERLTAHTQARLSYLIVLGYFVLKIMEGVKWIDPVRGPDEIAMLVAAYWFMRQRSTTKGDPNEIK